MPFEPEYESTQLTSLFIFPSFLGNAPNLRYLKSDIGAKKIVEKAQSDYV
jgi:hypothetical protein